MKRHTILPLLALLCAATAQPHFIWILTDGAGHSVKVVLSEELKPGQVGVKMIENTKLTLREEGGKETALRLTPLDAAELAADLPGNGSRVIYGSADLGINERGTKTSILLYYPKAIVGNPFDMHPAPTGAPVEIFPVRAEGGVKLRLMARGSVLPHSEVTVLLPDGQSKKTMTDDSGDTEVFPQTGRFGAWARYWEAQGGERDGKKYAETRHYATLVFDVPKPLPKPASFATLPQATSSFGAAVSDGWLYIYGGHTGATHVYSTDSVSGFFQRLPLTNPHDWEQLPAGPGLQGMNLAAWNGRIYRIGGMAPRNASGAKADNHSTAECAMYNPASKAWEPLPDLPEARSSHDVAVVGHLLIVAGGWNLRGDQPSQWFDTLELLDLSAAQPVWKSVKQPFRRRALIAAAHEGKVYVLGGLDEKSKVSHEVDIFDPATGAWSVGPPLPGPTLDGFAPAAAEHLGRLYVSLGDGGLYRLDDAAASWEKAAEATPRAAHRLVSAGNEILIIGGAAGSKMLSLIESVGVGGDGKE